MGIAIFKLFIGEANLGIYSRKSRFKTKFLTVYATPNEKFKYSYLLIQPKSTWFCLFDSLRPINNLSVQQGRVFLG